MGDYKAYGQSVAATTATWTDQQQAVGAPDNAVANGSANNPSITVRCPVPDLPDGAVISRVFIGARFTGSNLSNGTIRASAGDTTAVTAFTPIIGLLQNFEAILNAALFTSAILKDPNFAVTVSRSTSTATLSVDAVWVRVTTNEAISYTTAIANNLSFSSQSNLIGAPNRSAAASNSAGSRIDNTYGSLATFPTDGVINRVLLGVAARRSVDEGAPDTLTMAVGDTTPFEFLAEVSTSANFWFYEKDLNPALFTPAILRNSAALVARLARVSSSSNHTFYDATWLAVTYNESVPPPASRAKRWDGSAWQTAPVKRWTGSAWVETTVKRWDGSAWV